jgi:C-terminal processing protease CtpA/Prc
VTFLTRTPPDTSLKVQFRNPGSSQNQEASLKSVPEYDSLFASMSGFNLDSVEMPIFAQTLPESGLVYIRINTFSDDYSLMAKLWDRYIKNVIDAEAPGVIIDLRSNSGGSLGLAMDFAGYFFDHELTLYENYYYSETKTQFESTGYPTMIKPAPAYYQGPIAVLVSPECVSACEGFAYAMQQEDRSIIVGHYPTAGAFGEVGLGQYKLPGDYSIQFPTGKPQSSDGKVIIEGVGVVPDILVPVTEESALGTSDTVLETAVKALMDKIR